MLEIPAPCKTKDIPVPILTSAENRRETNEDVRNAYITKSVDETAFIQAVQENLL